MSNESKGTKSQGANLINALIKDSSDKASISDGVFTLGELHSDRGCLLVNLLALLDKVYSLKGNPDNLWLSHKSNSGETTEGMIHIGLTLPTKGESQETIHIGGLITASVEEELKSQGYREILESPIYPPLHSILKFFTY